uniref:Uncharacterized protein n=1 Tax=Lepeophtheirus salmonis TaxID=72036 RepID=A0A0K2USL1_LEPSM
MNSYEREGWMQINKSNFSEGNIHPNDHK